MALASFTVLLLARIPRLFLGKPASKIGSCLSRRSSPGRSEPLYRPLLLVKAKQSARLIIGASVAKTLASNQQGSSFIAYVAVRVSCR